ncbi:MAG: hypothetical protein ACI9W2_002234, partial [Gammaproteobacteria bacterium]
MSHQSFHLSPSGWAAGASELTTRRYRGIDHWAFIPPGAQGSTYHFFFLAAQGLQPFAAHGLQPRFAAHGLQLLAAHGLHGLQP